MESRELTTADDAQEIYKRFEQALLQLTEYSSTLRAMEIGPLKASVALEYAREAKKYIELVEGSELKTQSQRLFEAHRYWSRVLTRTKKPAEILLKYCNDFRSDWEVERRRRVESERHKREQQAKLFSEKQRDAEVEHLKEIGKTQEAEAKAAAPILPVTVNIDPDMGKPEGEVMVEVWQPKRDESGNIVFSDICSYLAWIAGNPPMYHLIKHEYGKLKKLLTDNRGMLQPPGLEIEHKFEPRTRRENDETDTR
jgi:hypothetical protein